jgi:hypothetical protein
MSINITDKIIAREQENRGYSSMESVYISNLLNERVALVCSRHAKLLAITLKRLGVFFNITDDSGELVTIMLSSQINQNDKL